jgi:hypothetical protein
MPRIIWDNSVLQYNFCGVGKTNLRTNAMETFKVRFHGLNYLQVLSVPNIR